LDLNFITDKGNIYSFTLQNVSHSSATPDLPQVAHCGIRDAWTYLDNLPTRQTSDIFGSMSFRVSVRIARDVRITWLLLLRLFLLSTVAKKSL
jgi:hypothetical protein